MKDQTGLGLQMLPRDDETAWHEEMRSQLFEFMETLSLKASNTFQARAPTHLNARAGGRRVLDYVCVLKSWESKSKTDYPKIGRQYFSDRALVWTEAIVGVKRIGQQHDRQPKPTGFSFGGPL